MDTHVGRRQLRDFLLGCVSEADQDEITRHLESCEACAASMLDVESDCSDELTDVLRGEDGTRVAPDRYQLGSEIARGGMGIVYEAYDHQLRRPVALKTARGGRGAAVRARRLVLEAQLTGQMQHPGVPPVHELGYLSDGRPFMAMKLIEGEPLSEILSRRSAPTNSLSTLLSVFARLCDTVAFAHERGIVHRDLKPSNVIVGRFGDTQVVDWGLARPVGERDVGSGDDSDSGCRSGSTLEGAVMGTPSYMAPEQARGETDLIGPHTDVFAIGSILCELLTGQPAYVGEDADVVTRAAIDGDLVEALQRLDECEADPALVSLTVRCLSPDLHNRPDTAAVVAAQMQQYFHEADVRARTAEVAKTKADARAEEAIRRRRLYVILAVLMLLIATTSGISAFVFRQQREFEKDLRTRLSAKTLAVQQQKVAADENLKLARTQSELRRELLYAADTQLAPLLWQSESGTASGLQAALDAHIPRLGERDLRGFEWRYFNRLLNESATVVDQSPLAVAGCENDTLCIFTRRGTIQHIDIHSGEVLSTIPVETSGDATYGLSGDGRLLAIASDVNVRLIDCSTGAILHRLSASRLSFKPNYLQFTWDNKLLCAGGRGRDKKACWWRTDTGAPVSIPLEPENKFPEGYQMVPGGREIARISEKYRTRLMLHELSADGKLVAGKRQIKYPMPGTVTGLVFDNTGTWAAVSGHASGLMRLINVENPDRRTEKDLHRSVITALAFADNARFASGGRDGVVKVWQIDDSGPKPAINLVKALKGHTTGIRQLAFTRDGKHLVSVDETTTRIWNLTTSGDLREQLTDQQGACHSLAFSPDGRWLIGSDNRATQFRLRDAATGKTVWSHKCNSVTSVAFSPDSRRLALGHPACVVTVWDIQSRKRIARFRYDHSRRQTLSVAFSRDGSKVAASYGILDAYNTAVSQKPIVWDIEKGEVECVLTEHDNACSTIRYNKAGTRLITASHVGYATVFDCKTWKIAGRLFHPGIPIDWDNAIEDLIFSPDERHLAMACANGTITVWEQGTGEVVRVLNGHSGPVYGVAWSHDGLTLASASTDQTVRLWNVATGREMMRLGDGQSYLSVAFSPDGSQLVAGGRAKGKTQAIDVWRVAPAEIPQKKRSGP